MDINTEQYKAAITLSNLTMYDLTPLTWHVTAGNHLEGQVKHDAADVRAVVNEWAEVLECYVIEEDRGDYTAVRLDTNYGDYGTFIKIWGHADTAY